MVDKAPQVEPVSRAKVKVIGVGGAGGNIIASVAAKEPIPGVEYVAVNTDVLALKYVATIAPGVRTIQVGEKLTDGFGVGGEPEDGKKAGKESEEALRELVSETHIAFIAAGMGGGTGTGIAPLIGELARKNKVKPRGGLAIALVTTPFAFEGRYRRQKAEEGIAELLDRVDTAIVVPNERLLSIAEIKTDKEWQFKEAMDKVNKELAKAVRAVARIISIPGIINLDLSDIRVVLERGGAGVLAIGTSTDEGTIEAARLATFSHFQGLPVTGARKVLINVAFKEKLALDEVDEAIEYIKSKVDPIANIRFGVSEDNNMEENIVVTVVAAGFMFRPVAPPLKVVEVVSSVKLIKPIKVPERPDRQQEEELESPAIKRYPPSLLGETPESS